MRRNPLTNAISSIAFATAALCAAPAAAQDRDAERALLEQIVEIPTVAGRGEMPRLIALLRSELDRAGFDRFNVQPHDDTETLIAAVESGPCASPHVKRMIRPMAEGRLADQFGLAIGLREKDSRYCLGMAKTFETGMAIGETAYDWYRLATKSVADQDDSAMLQIATAYNGKLPT